MRLVTVKNTLYPNPFSSKKVCFVNDIRWASVQVVKGLSIDRTPISPNPITVAWVFT